MPKPPPLQLIAVLALLVSCDWCLDTDADQVRDTKDNCPHTANANQEDADGDGRGDACDKRGVYHWGGECHDWGNLNVVGTPDNEDVAIQALLDRGFSRVYSSLGERPITDPVLVADWNRKLHAHDIESYLLMSHNTWAYDWGGLLTKIEARLIDFNQGHTADESFDGLALDVEPYALKCPATPCWSEDLDDRRDLLHEMMKMYIEVDQDLETRLGPDLPLLVAIPPWYDHLEEPDRDFYWESDVVRDAWFAELVGATDGLSLMTYCRDTFDPSQANSIGWMTEWEATHLAPGTDLRVALAAHVFAHAGVPPFSAEDRLSEGPLGGFGDCGWPTWTVAAELFSVAEQIEAWQPGSGPAPEVDVHNLRFLFDAIGVAAPRPAACP